MRRLCLFYDVVPTKLPAFISDFIPPGRQSQRHPNTFNSFSCRTDCFKNSLFPCIIGVWDKLNPEIRSSGSDNIFQPSASKLYNINDTIGIKLITKLRLGFSDLTQIQTYFPKDIKSALFL